MGAIHTAARNRDEPESNTLEDTLFARLNYRRGDGASEAQKRFKGA